MNPMTEKKTAPKKPMPKKEVKRVEKDLAEIAKVFQQIGFREFVNFLESPRKIMVRSFLSGIFKGFGVVVGMTVVVAIVVWFLTQLVDFPLIGQYFEDLLNLIESSTPQSMIPTQG
jgi:hypothetical protein